MRTCKTSIQNWINIIKEAKLPNGKKINGCITGSCMISDDFDIDAWDSTPDVDVFVYSEKEMVRAIDLLTMKYGLKYGVDEQTRTGLQEMQKDEWLMEDKRNKSMVTGTTLATIKLHTDDGVIVNVSCKHGCNSLSRVLMSFDMTCIMIGWDIRGGYKIDEREQWRELGARKDVAIPNPERVGKTDLDLVKTAYWVRQFDRVIKYNQRGIDCTKVAKWYIEEIDLVLERGNIWTSDNSEEFYQKFAMEFIETRDRISRWLKDKEE